MHDRDSVLLPLIRTLCALIKRCHGLIGRPDLYLHEVGFPIAALRAATLHRGLVDMLPSLRSTEHIVDLLPLEVHLLLEGLVDHEYIRAGLAEESEIGRRLLRQQQVRASRAKQHCLIIILILRRLVVLHF